MSVSETSQKRSVSWAFNELNLGQANLCQIDSQVIIDQKLAIFQNRVERPEFGIRNMTVQNEDECREKCTCSDPMCTLTSAKNYHQDIDEDKQQISEYFTKNKQNLQPPDDLTKPPEEELILLPNFVYGFALRSRKWGEFGLNLVVSSVTLTQKQQS